MVRRLIPVVAAALLFGVLGTVFFMTPRAAENTAPAVAGYSVEGRPLEYWTFGQGSRVLFFMASIHGTEGAGTPLLEKLIEWLRANPGALEGKQVIVMPVANPDGLQSGRRYNARGVDLNRNFPSQNRRDTSRFGTEAAPEPETVALVALLERYRPAVTVSIHQPLECIDYDGPTEAAALAERMAAACGLPVRKLGARQGSLGAWLGEDQQRAVLTMELPAAVPPDHGRLWQLNGGALTAIIAGSE